MASTVETCSPGYFTHKTKANTTFSTTHSQTPDQYRRCDSVDVVVVILTKENNKKTHTQRGTTMPPFSCKTMSCPPGIKKETHHNFHRLVLKTSFKGNLTNQSNFLQKKKKKH